MNKRMDLIIFHYHLLPGGVTDVIRHSLTALSRLERLSSIRVVCGRRVNTETIEGHMDMLRSAGCKMPMSLDVLPELDYLIQQSAPPEVEGLRRLLLDRFGSTDALWLVHNYHLGKNWVFTEALNRIALEGGQKMIFQIHDYPECARYANLNILRTHIDGSLYPKSPSLRYCVINMRDYRIMRDAGMEEGRIHLLENPVPAADNPAEDDVDRELLKKKLISRLPSEGRFHPEGEQWLYPVRSIRRKNVLEGGVLCALQDEPVNLIVTLPGISPAEKAYSDLCESAWHRGLIPGFWGTGTLPAETGIGYRQMISGSDLIFSSSVQEGFGYMYLNALLWKKPLLARSLDIMEGFRPLMKKGAAQFYNRVMVPVDKALREDVKTAYRDRLEELAGVLPPAAEGELRNELDKLIKEENFEFSFLSPAEQYGVLEKLRADKGYLQDCRGMNAPLLKQISELRKIRPRDLDKELYENYGEDAYRKAFTSIIESFTANFATFHGENRNIESIDRALENRFARLEFLRLLYR